MNLGRRWAQDGRKLSKLGPSWQQVAPKIRHSGARTAILGSTREVLRACWDDVWVICMLLLDSLKPYNTEGKLRFLMPGRAC